VAAFPAREILAADYPAVVSGVAAQRCPPRVRFTDRDSVRFTDRDIRELGWGPEFDAAVVTNSVLSDSDVDSLTRARGQAIPVTGNKP
jgi:hypothetical protein